MEVKKAIQNKRAIRQDQEKYLSEHEINQILNAGRRDQSSKKTQSWHFISIYEKPIL